MRQIRISIGKDVFKTLKDTFWTGNGGAVYLLGVFHHTYKQHLHTLKGVFNQRELMLMADSFKRVDKFPGHIPPGRFFMDTIKYQIEENRYAYKWDLDGDKLISKLMLLADKPYRIMCLAVWAFSCTHNNKAMDDNIKGML